MRALLRSVLALAALLAAAPALAQAQPRSDFPPAIEAQIRAAKESMMSDQAEALRHAAAIDGLALGLRDERRRMLALATARWLAAEAHIRNEEPAKAAPLLTDGLNLIRSIPEPIKLRGDLMMSQGAFFMARDQAVQALESYQNAFRIFGEVKEPRSQAIALQNIGGLYSVANDDARAEEYFHQAAVLFTDDPVLSLPLHNSRGNVLAKLGRDAEASKEYEAAIVVARGMNKPLLEARLLSNLARSQVALKRYDDANRPTELIRFS